MLPCVSSPSAMEQAQQELLNNPALCQVLFKNLPHLAASSMAARAFGPDERSTSRELVPAHDRDRPPKQRRQQKDLEQDEEMPPTRLPSPSRRPRRTGRRNGSRPRASQNGLQKSKQEVKPTADLLASIILALLNHEDELTALRYHHGWIFYATVHQANSVVPSLARIQQQWKSDQPQDPPGTPVRHALFLGLLHELHTRAQGFDHVAYDSTNQDKESALISLPGALASRGRHHTDENPAFYWNYMRWDAKQRKVVIDAQRPPLSPKVVSTHLAAMLKLDQEQLTKFRPSRPLRANLTEERPVIAFLLELALTIGDDHEAMHAFRLLANNSVWNLVGVTMRREGLRRSPQMQTLRDQLEALRTGGNEG